MQKNVEIMICTIEKNGRKIEYNFERKKVKNINLRVKSDGTVYVSANSRVSKKTVEDFLYLKFDFLTNALDKYKSASQASQKQYFTENDIKNVILNLCEKAYPYFEKRGVKYPQIKFRKMVSRWGSCNHVKGILNFNINLMYAPVECVKYVVLHEFTHFLQPDHSSAFYEELSKICPEWKSYRAMLKNISIR